MRENLSSLSPLLLWQRVRFWLKIRANSNDFWEAHSQIFWMSFHRPGRGLLMFIQPAQVLSIRLLIPLDHVLRLLTQIRSHQIWLS